MLAGINRPLLGTTGVDWLQARGWRVSASVTPFQLRMDEVIAPQSVLRRAYVAPMRGVHLRTTDADPRSAGFDVFHIIKGTARVSAATGGQVEVGRDAVLLRRAGVPLEFECAEPVAMNHIEIAQPILPAGGTDALDRTDADPGAAHVFGSLLASVFTARPANRSTSRLIETAVLSLIEAVLDLNRIAAPDSVTPSEQAILVRAQEVILARASEPGLTVQAIADEVAVSRSYLYRVFARANSTPQRYLSQVRASHAAAQLERAGQARPAVRREIAQRAGFSSVRAMSSAIASS